MSEKRGVDLIPEDFGDTSAAPDRVLLPYTGEVWGDLMLAAESEVVSVLPSVGAGDLSYEDVVDSLHVQVLFNVQCRRIRTTAYCTAVSPLTQRPVPFRVLFQMENRMIRDVLSRFFRNGGAGLSTDYRTYFQEVYQKWGG